MNTEVPIWEKSTLTIEEAAKYSNIGENRLRIYASDANCPFVLRIGNKMLIKRRLFEKYIDEHLMM